MKLFAALAPLFLLLTNVEEGHFVGLNIVWNNSNTPVGSMGSGAGEYIHVLDVPRNKDGYFIASSLNGILDRQIECTLNYSFARRNYDALWQDVRTVNTRASLSPKRCNLHATYTPPANIISGVSAPDVAPNWVDLPPNFCAFADEDRDVPNSFTPDVSSKLNNGYFLLPLHGLSLCDSGCNELVRLHGGRSHFVQLGLSDGATDYRNAKRTAGNDRCCDRGERGHPFRGIELWKYVAAFILIVAAFTSMLLAYFWLLFAVAVPKGIKFRWLFDRFNVHLWSGHRRGLVALALFLISIALIITAVRLALPHRDLPSPHPLNQISSIRTV